LQQSQKRFQPQSGKDYPIQIYFTGLEEKIRCFAGFLISGHRMSNSEQAKALHDAVTGLQRVADTIADLSGEPRLRALKAVEQKYQRTMEIAGCPERDARRWAATLMSRLRKLLPDDGNSEKVSLTLLYDELTRSEPQPNPP
jgi:hypothetical protein